MDDTNRPDDTAAAFAVCRPVQQAQLVIERWTCEQDLEPSSVRRLGDLLERFARRLEATGVSSIAAASPSDCEGFLWAPTRRGQPPALYTVHLRRTTLRTLYRTLRQLDVAVADPTAELDLPPKRRAGIRPLEDEEINLLRVAALGRTRGRDRAAAIVALAETTATSSEIPRVRWTDVHLTTGQVQLPGAEPVVARTGQLSPWGQAALARIAARCRDDDTSITYRGHAGRTSHAAQAQTSGMLRAILNDAGLTDDDLKPSSVRLWAPAQRLAAGARIEDIATMVGLRSLDATAELLGYRWHEG